MHRYTFKFCDDHYKVTGQTFSMHSRRFAEDILSLPAATLVCFMWGTEGQFSSPGVVLQIMKSVNIYAEAAHSAKRVSRSNERTLVVRDFDLTDLM